MAIWLSSIARDISCNSRIGTRDSNVVNHLDWNIFRGTPSGVKCQRIFDVTLVSFARLVPFANVNPPPRARLDPRLQVYKVETSHWSAKHDLTEAFIRQKNNRTLHVAIDNNLERSIIIAVLYHFNRQSFLENFPNF